MAASPDYMEDIEEEENLALEVELKEKEKECLSLEEKEPAEIREPTLEDFLAAFENSHFCLPHFICPISRGSMVDPVILHGSGHSVDRVSAIECINYALNSRKTPTCPMTQQELTIKISRDKLPNRLLPEAYFSDNMALKNIISDTMQKFRNSEGDKYRNTPHPIQTENENAKLVPTSAAEDEDTSSVSKAESKEKEKEEESAEMITSTLKDFLAAFEKSHFCLPHFICPISKGLMLNPVVLNGSGRSVDRDSAIQMICDALAKRETPKCPRTGEELPTTGRRGNISYFSDNATLKSIISHNMQRFKDSEGDKYQKVTDPMIKPRGLIQTQNKNPELVNRNIFFTEGCRDITMACMAPMTLASSAACGYAINKMVLPSAILSSSCQTIALCSTSILFCLVTVVACSEALKFGSNAEAWYLEEERRASNAESDVREALIMEEGDEMEEGNGARINAYRSSPRRS